MTIKVVFLGVWGKLGYVGVNLLHQSIYRARQPLGSSQPTTKPQLTTKPLHTINRDDKNENMSSIGECTCSIWEFRL